MAKKTATTSAASTRLKSRDKVTMGKLTDLADDVSKKALGGREPLGVDRAAERAGLLRPPARKREAVLRDEPRRGEQVRDELHRRVRPVRCGERLAGLPGLGAGADGPQVRDVGSRPAHCD